VLLTKGLTGARVLATSMTLQQVFASTDRGGALCIVQWSMTTHSVALHQSTSPSASIKLYVGLVGHFKRVHLLQRVSYLNMTIYPVTSVFILIYALTPVVWIIPDEIYIQRPFTRYIEYLLVIIGMIHMIGWLGIKWAGITWLDYWRNEQFFMIGSTSAYPAAVLHMAVNLLTKKGIHFRVTSKQTAADDNDKFADLYDFRWVPMLFPSVVVLIFNVGAIGVAIGKTAVYFGVWTPAQKKHAAMCLLFNIWVMFLLYPFALAIMGRWAKRPIILSLFAGCLCTSCPVVRRAPYLGGLIAF
jgi:hypothetical protein